jgi:DNA-binding Xre family transcriptional regulator
MSIHWKLKTLLSQKYSIYSATVFQKKIIKSTGIIISLPNICKLLNNKPKVIKLETMEIICSTLNCGLQDFVEVRPRKYKNTDNIKKLSFKNTPHSKRAVSNFPCPKDYEQ